MRSSGTPGAALTTLVAVVALAGGCGGAAPRDTGVTPEAWGYPEHQFVVTTLSLPLSSADATKFAFDLDGNGTLDNQMGMLFVALKGQMGETTPQSSVRAAIGDGRIIMLLSFYVQPDMQDSPVSNMWAFNGQRADPPLLNGPQPGGTFFVDPTAPQDLYCGGSITASLGRYGSDEATMLLRLPFGGGDGILILPLTAVRVEFTAAAGGESLTEGRMGGAIRKQDVDDTLVPTVVDMLNEEMRAYCSASSGTCTCESGSGAETIRQMFDTDGSCDVSPEEGRGNAIINALLEPDVTLSDGSGGVSVGFGFTAVNAVFDHLPPPTD